MKIVHMTAVHPWHDTRIFTKMCATLVEAGHEVHLIAPGAGDVPPERRCGVILHEAPSFAGRTERIWRAAPAILDLAASLAADVYHFHDPEFLRVAVGFQRRIRRPVVYDVHEDYRLQILNKHWLPRWSRQLISWSFARWEDRTARQLAGIVPATPDVARHFLTHRHCAIVRNFPIIDEFADIGHDASVREAGHVAYIGGLTGVRGVSEMVQAVAATNGSVRLSLAGRWHQDSERQQCVRLPGWSRVNELGFLDRRGVVDLLSRAQVGICALHPIPNYVTSYPVKLFEYMAAGLPVIASDFPLWREFVSGPDCGRLVDPLDPVAIGQAMEWFAENPVEAMAMGQRARATAVKDYSWHLELERLIELYEATTRDS